jgi:hypothetical protein
MSALRRLSALVVLGVALVALAVWYLFFWQPLRIKYEYGVFGQKSVAFDACASGLRKAYVLHLAESDLSRAPLETCVCQARFIIRNFTPDHYGAHDAIFASGLTSFPAGSLRAGVSGADALEDGRQSFRLCWRYWKLATPSAKR